MGPDDAAASRIADVAKAEEARRKSVKKPAKVYTNGNLTRRHFARCAADADCLGSDRRRPPMPARPTPRRGARRRRPSRREGSGVLGRPDRMPREHSCIARRCSRTRCRAASMRCTTDFVNRDDPAQRAKIEADRKAALAELERVKKELDEQTKAITAIEDEARRAGVPAGWLRPGA